MQNRHMGTFYRNLVNLRESSKYRYGDCLVAAGNDIEKAALCIRGYLSNMDADNVTLTNIVEQNCSKYFWETIHSSYKRFTIMTHKAI